MVSEAHPCDHLLRIQGLRRYLGDELNVFIYRKGGDQVVKLKDEAHLGGPVVRQLVV